MVNLIALCIRSIIYDSRRFTFHVSVIGLYDLAQEIYSSLVT